MQWAKDNLHNSFDNVVCTDESTIQLENNQTFLYSKVGSAPKRKPQAKHPFKVMACRDVTNYEAEEALASLLFLES